jgi:predicted PurR-regulated permease PerM
MESGTQESGDSVPYPHRERSAMERRTFLVILALVSVLFLFVLKPFYSALFWACTLTIVVYPFHRRVKKFVKGPNLAALATLGVLSVVVLTPALLLFFSFLKEGSWLYGEIQSGRFDLSAYLDKIRAAAPALERLLERAGVDSASVQAHLSEVAVAAGRFLAAHAVAIGQNAFAFLVGVALMLYLAFFMLRDGPEMVEKLIRALPLGDDLERSMIGRFAEVTRATVRGSFVIALVQGALGGIVFWSLGIGGALLWGAAMAVCALVPVVGTAIVWVPVAAWLFAVGSWGKGLFLVLFAAGVIGSADNVLRPILVGRDTKLPDYVVLLSTLGGFAIFGMNGFIVGPVVAALFLALWQVFIDEFNPAPVMPAPPQPEKPAESDANAPQ